MAVWLFDYHACADNLKLIWRLLTVYDFTTVCRAVQAFAQFLSVQFGACFIGRTLVFALSGKMGWLRNGVRDFRSLNFWDCILVLLYQCMFIALPFEPEVAAMHISEWLLLFSTSSLNYIWVTFCKWQFAGCSAAFSEDEEGNEAWEVLLSH